MSDLAVGTARSEANAGTRTLTMVVRETHGRILYNERPKERYLIGLIWLLCPTTSSLTFGPWL